MFWKKNKKTDNPFTSFTSANPVANEVAKALAGVDGDSQECFDPILGGLANQVNEIISKQFEPKRFDLYYTIKGTKNGGLFIEKESFGSDCEVDIANLLQGNCYETRIEAERARLDLLEKIDEYRKKNN